MSKSLLFALALTLFSIGAAFAHDGPFGWQMSPASLPKGFADGTDSYIVQKNAFESFERQNQRLAATPAAQPAQPINR